MIPALANERRAHAKLLHERPRPRACADKHRIGLPRAAVRQKDSRVLFNTHNSPDNALAATFLNKDESYTAPVVLKNMVGAYGADWGPFAAGSLLVSLPVIAVFFVLQRHLVRGLLQGGVKE